MPDVRNCKRCGKVYNHIGGVPICHTCRQVDEEQFKRIKEYLYDNPGASVSQVATELDISVEKIKRFLKEGRLEIVGDNGNLVLECELCGKSIKTGRYCDTCEIEITKSLKTVAGEMNQSLHSSRNRESALKFLSKDEQKNFKK